MDCVITFTKEPTYAALEHLESLEKRQSIKYNILINLCKGGVSLAAIQEIFNSREIAIGIWAIVVLTVVLMSKSLRPALMQFVNTTIHILFCRKIVIFSFIFIAFLLFALDLLKWTTFWDISMLKDTILWVIFVELPLFGKAIEKAKDYRFFYDLVIDNLKFFALFEFFVGFWTFDLWLELIAIPTTALISSLCVLASREKDHKPAKTFFDMLLAIWGVIIIIHAISSTIKNPDAFFIWDTLKSLLLPVFLLILNLPVVYGLALYSGYEVLFIKIKNGAKDKWKMKLQVFCFAGFSLSRVSAIRRNLQRTIHISLNADDMRKNLAKLKKHLAMQIGENYMKRAKYYIGACIIAALASLIGLVLANSEASIKDILTFNSVLIIPRFKEILTYILSVSFVFSIALLVYSVGFSKQKNEEITQIKKFAIFDFLFALKKQQAQLQDDPPIDDPVSLFVNYMLTANELKEACTKALDVYGNLLTNWERESVEMLKTSAHILLADATTGGGNFSEYDVSSFCDYYNAKVKTTQHSGNFNAFTTTVKSDVEKYAQRIESTYKDFKRYYE